MEEWLASELDVIGLNDPDIIEYLLPIMQDKEEDIDDVLESCRDFLEASLGEETDLSEFLDHARTRIQQDRAGEVDTSEIARQQLEEKRKQAVANAKKAEEELARLEQERAAQVERPLTKEERMERKKMREITARYDAMQLDENGDFVYVGNDDEDDFAVCNSNVDHVNEMHPSNARQRRKNMQRKSNETKPIWNETANAKTKPRKPPKSEKSVACNIVHQEPKN